MKRKRMVLPETTQDLRKNILPAEREEFIKKLLSEQNRVTVEELADYFQVTKATIRRDLDKICDGERFKKTYGGAICNSNVVYEIPYELKALLHQNEKNRIGARAAEMVKDGDIILIDSGTTGLTLAKNLSMKKQITIVTNDLLIALNAKVDSTSNIIMMPGQRVEGTNAVIGRYAEKFLKEIRVDKVFMTADAIDTASGITNSNYAEMGIKIAMAEAGATHILMADSSKFDKRSLVPVYPDLRKLDCIISNKEMPEEVQKKYLVFSNLILV